VLFVYTDVTVTVVCANVLWLFQLLSKKHNKTTAERPSVQRHLLSVDVLMLYVTDARQQITEAEALYVLASRYIQLHR